MRVFRLSSTSMPTFMQFHRYISAHRVAMNLQLRVYSISVEYIHE